MTFTFNCDEHNLWNKLDVNSVMLLALELHPDEVIQHCADVYNFSEEETYEYWGVGSMMICEQGAQPSIQIDFFNVIFTI